MYDTINDKTNKMNHNVKDNNNNHIVTLNRDINAIDLDFLHKINLQNSWDKTKLQQSI